MVAMKLNAWLAMGSLVLGLSDSGAQAGEVYLIDHVYFSRPGPRVVQGLEILAQLTYPGRFSGYIQPGEVLKLDLDLASGAGPGEIGRCFRPFPRP